MTRLLRVLAPLALLAAVGLPAAPAWAHAALVSSDPADGQRLSALPGTATLTFNEEISPPSYVVVTAPDGSRADRGEPRVDGSTVTVDLAKGEEGTYALAFRVISADGHPVTGRLTFVVGDGPLDTTGPTLAATPADSPTSARAAAADGGGPGLGTVQIAVGAGLLAAAGLLWVLARRRPR
ncbi:copper resistance protein CopC [Nocardioides sp. W3-2-3]|uniref:copper resistance CopC family protein n=1 Tax=Nocardioides convexus TaxID=2712224 RepID=UPI0024187AD8|nr:copper resistance CopC family protein [Nocardioides convexus]NHA01095.1 copper resistance protein CopC [Nocardioides convexus]